MARLIRAIPRVLVKLEQVVIQRQFLNGIVHVFCLFVFLFFFQNISRADYLIIILTIHNGL